LKETIGSQASSTCQTSYLAFVNYTEVFNPFFWAARENFAMQSKVSSVEHQKVKHKQLQSRLGLRKES